MIIVLPRTLVAVLAPVFASVFLPATDITFSTTFFLAAGGITLEICLVTDLGFTNVDVPPFPAKVGNFGAFLGIFIGLFVGDTLLAPGRLEDFLKALPNFLLSCLPFILPFCFAFSMKVFFGVFLSLDFTFFFLLLNGGNIPTAPPPPSFFFFLFFTTCTLVCCI